MTTALLLYGYAVGVFSSRKLARATFEDVAFRMLAADEHPHFTTINEMRSAHRATFADLLPRAAELEDEHAKIGGGEQLDRGKPRRIEGRLLPRPR
jgi:hypothetical protein